MANRTESFTNRFFSSPEQLKRIIVLTALVLVLSVGTFASYYYYDRYYTSEVPLAEQSLSEAEQAVRDNPADPAARINLAESYMQSGQFEHAIGQALLVKQAYPEDVRADFVLGISYSQTGSPELAIEPLGKFIEARKDGPMPGLDKQLQAALYYLGDSYLLLGQPELAIEPFVIGTNLSLTDADVIYKLGIAYSRVGDYDNAMQAFHRAVQFVPTFTEVYAAMADVFETTGEPALAGYARGMEAFSTKDYAGALSLLKSAAEARPDYAPAFTGLGMTYEALNDLPNALAAYETAVGLDANDFTALRGFERVQAGLQQ